MPPPLRFGVAHDFRCPPGSDHSLADVYAQTLEQVALLDRLGIGLGEFGLTDVVTWGSAPGLQPTVLTPSMERFASEVVPLVRAALAPASVDPGGGAGAV